MALAEAAAPRLPWPPSCSWISGSTTALSLTGLAELLPNQGNISNVHSMLNTKYISNMQNMIKISKNWLAQTLSYLELQSFLAGLARTTGSSSTTPHSKYYQGSLVELVEKQPAKRCVVGSIHDPCRQRPRGVAVDFGPKQSGCLINQLGDRQFLLPAWLRFVSTRSGVQTGPPDAIYLLYWRVQ